MAAIFLEMPLLRRELLGLLRARRAFWLLFVLVLFSLAVPLLGWPRSGASPPDPSQPAGVFIVFTAVHLTLALFIVASFCAAAISGEREAGTYELVHSTLISPSSIIFSKLLASSAYVFIALLATAPAACVLYLQGGLAFDQVLSGYAAAFTAVMLAAFICLAASLRSHRTAHAILRGIVWTIFWNGGLSLLLWIAGEVAYRAAGRPAWAWRGYFHEILIGLSPYTAFGYAVESGYFFSLAFYVAYAAILLAAYLAYLIWRVRKGEAWEGRLGTGGPRKRKVRRTYFTRVLLALGEERDSGASGFPLLSNPVFLKEVRSEIFGRAWFRRLAFWVPLALFASLSYLEREAEPKILLIGTAALFLILLLVPALAGGAVAREREQESLDQLLGSRLAARQVLAGKLLASLYAGWGIVAAALWVLLAGLPSSLPDAPRSGGAEIAGMTLSAAAILVLAHIFTAALSIAVSAVSSRAAGALVGSYVVTLFTYLAGPFVMIATGRDEQARTWLDAAGMASSPLTALFPGNLKLVLTFFVVFYSSMTIALTLTSGRLLEKLSGRAR